MRDVGCPNDAPWPQTFKSYKLRLAFLGLPFSKEFKLGDQPQIFSILYEKYVTNSSDSCLKRCHGTPLSGTAPHFIKFIF